MKGLLMLQVILQALQKWKWGPTTTWSLAGIVSLIWWPIAAQGSHQRLVLTVWLSFASVMVGALIGFLFSSYGEENNTLGKIRDWLVGGLTTLTVVKASSIKQVLLVFAAGPGPIEFAYVVGASVFYVGLGFFFMFFQRELILNVLLAQSRAERGKLDGSHEAGQVIQRFLLRLPASVLTGVSQVGEIPDLNEKEEQQLKDLLYSADVETFLKQADDVAAKGALDWDITSKSAYVRYYRVYFEKDHAGIGKAVEWVTRALNMNPLHVDLTMKYADLLGLNEDYASAASILEKLILREEAPVLVRQWLGYYLRFLPDRLDDAIAYSKQYLAFFPHDSDPLFNIAYVYAYKYCRDEVHDEQRDQRRAKNREMALSTLKTALRDQPNMSERVRSKWTESGKAFECFVNDGEFTALFPAQPKSTTTSTTTQ
jgi:tetratricopeptide (TPR) repeat protein